MPPRLDEAQAKAPATSKSAHHEQLLALKEVDAVLIGTPDHWHAAIAIDATRAGKDVCLEKPPRRTRAGATEIVKAARMHERVCQAGLQQRSGPIYLDPLEKCVRSGALGRITHIDAVWHTGPARPLRRTPADKPSSLDSERLRGPVKYRDWDPAQYWNFRAFLDSNGGKMTDFGHHWLDVVHMYTGQRAPRLSPAASMRISATGRRRRTPATRCSTATASRCCSSPTHTGFPASTASRPTQTRGGCS